MKIKFFSYCIAVILIISAQICPAEVVDRVLAIVNDDIVLLSDLTEALDLLKNQLEQSGTSDIEQRVILANQRPKALDQLINEKLTNQQARRLGITVNDTEVDMAVERIMAINQFSEQELIRLLKQDGMTLKDYRAQLKEQLLQQQIVNREVKSKIVITDADIKAYYEAHKDQYIGQVKYHLRHLLMKSNGTNETDRVRERMAALYQRLTAGAAFEDLARDYSHSATAETGGDLGVFESRVLAAPIRQALDGLNAGQFTPVLETEQGFQIFYVQEVINTGGKTLQEATEEIHDQLFAEMVDRKFQTWLKGLRDRAHVKVMD
ncbi:MAG: hypothetical protein HKP58_20075 [Desulfatitalea sp.]|nr:SurA N-terminal domain-containing protein [Desulfatitalea sp.]NNK02717.1 hypothetical protein [Desulfatitalea sp.]